MITFSASIALKDAIKRAAAAERRTVSNWMVVTLEEYLRHQSSGKPHLLVAEPKAKYGTGK